MGAARFRYLTAETILAVHGAVIQSRCDVGVLLGGIDARFVANIGASSKPAEALLAALHAMNAFEALDDGEVPLAVFLASAEALMGHMREARDVVLRALAEVRGRRAGVAAAPRRAKPHPRVRDVFVGREEELAALEKALLPEQGDARPVAVFALQGMPGVGKSYLADRFAVLHAGRFPGGYVKLSLGPDDVRSGDELGGELARLMQIVWRGPETWDALRETILRRRALVHIENADAAPAGHAVGEVAEALEGCALIVTGRLVGLGESMRWARVEMKPFEEMKALEQLAEEAGGEVDTPARRSLVREVGYLPLAIHLAAGHLRAGKSETWFVTKLHDPASPLALGPRDAADPVLRAAGDKRGILQTTFALSLEWLKEALGKEGEIRLASFAMLGHLPLSGFGKSLGATVSGMTEEDFDELLDKAVQLSLASLVPKAKRADGAWSLHPLLAALLRWRVGQDEAWIARMTAWFLERLPSLGAGREDEQGKRWKEIGRETDALVDWLAHVPLDDATRVASEAQWYAYLFGPYLPWAAFADRLLAGTANAAIRANALWILSAVAERAGALDKALAAAEEMIRVHETLGNERGTAISHGFAAGILQARGQLDEALRIRNEEQLPVYERLGDVRARAVTLGKIADILQARGQLDEALRIRNEEELPVYERLGDVRERAVTLGKIADILQARGQLDEALRIHEEHELPIYQQLGDTFALVRRRAHMALLRLRRAHPADRDEAAALLRLALRDAEAMRIPEADQIRAFQRLHGLA